MRTSAIMLAFLVAAAVVPAQDADFRRPEPRPAATIFSPLDLPAPNSIRTGAGAPGPDYWQQKVDYRIQAELLPESRTVRGRAAIRYHNESPDQLDYLWLNLEQNAFREDSIAARIGGRTAIGMRDAEGDGYTIQTLRAKGKDLPYRVYDTLARVELPKPIPPGGGVFDFEVEWEFVIPERVFRRFGIRKAAGGTIFEVAQWFPSVAVYDDVHGWNTLPYIGTGEFYSNFGDYEVEITAPAEYVVVCTGELLNPKEVFTREQAARLRKAARSSETVMIIDPDEAGGPNSRPPGKRPLTWKFRAENVRTVAWAASDVFVLDAAGLDGILIQSAYPKSDYKVWKNSTQMLRAAIAGYNRRWFRYPYPVATNVSGAEGGMEYPMIIFCRAGSEEGLYDVTTHEIGHNWFPMVVNTDERRHAWMDEGFNTFINSYSGEDWFDDPGWGRQDPGSWGGVLRNPRLLPIETPADHFPAGMYGQIEYSKTAVGLTMLRESILGPERFDYAFRKYIERWAFKSPQPADFFRCMEDAAGVDLAWFWRGWFLESATVDLEVTGVDQPEENRLGRITFRSLGGMPVPLRYRVGFADGTSEEYDLPVEVWYTSNRIVERVPGDRRIVSVEADWREEFPDINRDNNLWLASEEEEDAR